MMGPAIELTGADTVPSPHHGDDALMVRPLSRQSYSGHSSEPEFSSNPIAPLKPPKTPLNSKRPASVSLSSAGDFRTPSPSGSDFTNRRDQDNETSAAQPSNHAGDHSTPDIFKTAPSSPAIGTSVKTPSAPYEVHAIDYYYPFPSQDHGISPDQDTSPGDTRALSSATSRPVTTCIDAPVTFHTTWYSHFAAPEFFICSRCYADHIESSQFRDAFHVSAPAEGKPRVCRFSSPRMKDDLWKKAVASDYLQPVTDWMQLRSRVLDCRGAKGAKASEGAKWYAPKPGAYPAWFGVCQACYEDRVKVFPKLSAHFGPHPETPPPNESWYCDFAVPFAQKEYKKQGPTGDWATFVREARARSEMPACPGQESTLAYGKAWFRPVHGPDWLLICSACFCDRVFHTADAGKWAPDEQLSNTPEQMVRCPMAQFNISMAMSRAHELKDFSVFWAAMDKLSQEKFCGPHGITDGVWYTLHGVEAGSDQYPAGRQTDLLHEPVPPRARDFVPLLLETYYTQSPAALAAYADEYAAIPPCPGTRKVKGRRWYGWEECAICPECHHDFARKYEGLAALMPLKNAPIEGDRSIMCEMYSPRMRDLYLLCNGTAQAAPDPKPLLEFAERRRRVFAETFLRLRMMSPGARLGMDREEVEALEKRWRSVE
ncbi:hypothetical protein PG997_006679 [Apiospora hydei]|uniref:Integral membrane protein n=1 Tax=Apiospora hydei TaxID=1337664 RepID=A0ABR1WPG1_9PEZI